MDDDDFILTGAFTANAVFGSGEVRETILTATGEIESTPTESTEKTTAKDDSNTDVFLARYSSTGGLSWAKSAGGTGADAAYDVAVLVDGSSLVAGVFDEQITFGTGTTLQSYGDEDAFLAYFNSLGQLSWAARAGGSGDDGAYSLQGFGDGSCIVAGSFQGIATFASASSSNKVSKLTSGSDDAFLAFYATGGELAWVQTAGGLLEDRCYGIDTYDGEIFYGTGMFRDTATFAVQQEEGESDETDSTDTTESKDDTVEDISLTTYGQTDAFVAAFIPPDESDSADGTEEEETGAE